MRGRKPFKKRVEEQLNKLEISKDNINYLKTILSAFEERLRRDYPYILSPRETKDLGFWYYNRHDFHHIERVLQYIEKINEKISLHPLELFILYLSTIGHDIGMSEPEIEILNAYESKFGKSTKETNFWRKIHAFRSGQIISKILESFVDDNYFPNTLKSIIEEIAASHTSQAVTEEEVEVSLGGHNFKIRSALLCGLLRLADLCDNDRRRLPPENIIGKVIALASLKGEPYITSVRHYLRRYLITGISVKLLSDQNIQIIVSIDKMFRSIVINVPYFGMNKINIYGKEEYKKILKEFTKELGQPSDKKVNKIEEQREIIGISKKLLKKYGINITWKVQFTGSYSQIEKTDVIIKWERIAREYIKKESLFSSFSSEPVPIVSNFVDRRDELQKCKDVLLRNKALLIYGLPGVGKTALAVKVAESFANIESNVFYYAFHKHSSLEEILLHIGIKLEELGMTKALDIIKNSDYYSIHHKVTLLLPYFNKILMIFDDIHELDSISYMIRKDIEKFFYRIMKYLNTGLKVILVGREIPSILRYKQNVIEYLSINGLDREGYIKYLSDVLKVSSNSEISFFNSFYNLTKGHPLVLNMLVSILPWCPEYKIKEILFEKIKTGLINEVYNYLTEKEKHIIELLSILKEPIEFLSLESLVSFAPSEVLEILESLNRKMLLDIRENSKKEKYYSVHPLVKEVVESLIRPEKRNKYCIIAGEHYVNKGNYIKAIEYFIRSGDLNIVNKFYDKFANQAKILGYYEYIGLIAENILKLNPPQLLTGKCKKDLAFSFLRKGEIKKAQRLYNNALQLLEKYNNDLKTVRELVEIYRYLTDIEHMEDRYESALEIASRGIKRASMLPNDDLTRIYMESQFAHIKLHIAPSESIKLFKELVNKCKEKYNRVAVDILYMLGDALVVCEEYEEALKILKESANYAEEIKYKRGIANILRRKADILLRLNLIEEAMESCKRAEEIYLQIGERGYAYLLNTKAEIYKLMDDLKTAERLHEQALDKAKSMGNSNRIAHSKLGIAEALRLQGITAENLYEEAFQVYKRIKSIWGMVNVRISQSLIALSHRKYENYEKFIREAENLLLSYNSWPLKHEKKLLNKIKRTQNPYEKYPLIFH